MARYNSLRHFHNDPFASILNDIHSKMARKMRRLNEDARAKQIENVLVEIKRTAIELKQGKQNSAVLKTVKDEIVQLIQTTFNKQITAHTALKEPFNLFQRQHQRVQAVKADDIFEEQLGYLIEAAASMRQINVDIDLILGGQDIATTATINNLTKQMESQIISITNKAIQNQAKNINQKNPKLVRTIQAKAGKVDIRTAVLEVEGKTDDIISNFLRVISGATFTLKNYKTKSWKDGELTEKDLRKMKIHLGDSNPYKAITGALSEIYPNIKIQNIIYYRGMEILSGQSEPPDSASLSQVQQHFGHLRFIFELRGSGLIDEHGMKQTADFFIWNDPTSEKIIVRSTAALIQDRWERYASAFSAISLKAAKL